MLKLVLEDEDGTVLEWDIEDLDAMDFDDVRQAIGEVLACKDG